MEQWIESTLPVEIQNVFDPTAGTFSQQKVVVLETFENGATVTCPVTTVVSLLGTTAPPTYAELSALPVSAGGWQQYFDAWKAAGYIS